MLQRLLESTDKIKRASNGLVIEGETFDDVYETVCKIGEGVKTGFVVKIGENAYTLKEDDYSLRAFARFKTLPKPL